MGKLLSNIGKRMKKRRKIVLIMVAALVVLLLVATSVVLQIITEPDSYEKRDADRKRLQFISASMSIYFNEYGLPYDERGEEYALYKLKPLIDKSYNPWFKGDNSAEYFNHIKSENRAKWFDYEERIANIDYEYINKDGFILFGVSSDLIILAEKREHRSSRDGIMVLTAEEIPLRLRFLRIGAIKQKKRIVGTRYSDYKEKGE